MRSEPPLARSGAEAGKVAAERNGYVRDCVSALGRDQGYPAWARLLPSAACLGSLSLVLAAFLRWGDGEEESASPPLPSLSPPSSASPPSGLLTLLHCVLPLFSLLSAFFWLGLYLIRCGRGELAPRLLAACCLGETLLQAASLLGDEEEQLMSAPASAVLLGCLAAATLLLLRVGQGIGTIIFTSLLRTVSLLSLDGVRASWRPFLAYFMGILGVLLARYAVHILPGTPPGIEEKIPVIKRRRRSSSVIAAEVSNTQLGSKPPRRTSLPCIQREQ
eukprot:g39276.t1